MRQVHPQMGAMGFDPVIGMENLIQPVGQVGVEARREDVQDSLKQLPHPAGPIVGHCDQDGEVRPRIDECRSRETIPIP
jgi:hypothetical protein